MRYKKSMPVFLILLLLVSCFSCAGTGNQTTSSQPTAQQTTFKALMTSKVVYDGAFKVLGVMYAQGKISESVKDKIIKAGNTYMIAHNIAAQELLDGKTPDLTTVSKALDVFLQTVAPYYKP